MPPRKTAAAKKAAAAAAAAEKAEKEEDKEETVVDVPLPSAEVGDKREREEEEPLAKEEEKKAKVELDNGGEEEVDPPSASAAVMAEVETEVATEGKKSPTWTPVKLGPKTFDAPEDAIKYISWLLNTVTTNQDLNDYERMVGEGMLRRGHEDAGKKIGENGIKSIQVKWHLEHDSKCYYVVRNDGTMSDFSYRKCVEGCFPGWDKSNASKSEYKPEGRRYGGRGGGRRHHGGGGGGGGGGYRRY